MTRSSSPRNQTLAAIVLGIAIAGFAWSAMAGRNADDRAVATELLAEQAQSAAPAASHARTEASRALQRADQARAAGDTAHAKLLEGLAREWAEMANDITRATTAEHAADAKQRAAASASGQIRKTHAWIETLVARRARAQGELQQLHGASSAAIPSAALSAAMLRPPTSSSAAPKGSK